MSDTVENPVINLKLIIDEKKNKVVFAEAGEDFVDTLFNFVTLPMGTVVRLMEKYQKSESIAIGCFNNIYASLANMEIKHFRTEACKQMLLYPRSLNQDKCLYNRLRIDDNEATKRFVCSSCVRYGNDSKQYSNFNTSRCSCGKLMSEVIQVDEEEGQLSGGNCLTSFIITDDLKVVVESFGMTFNVLKDLGYADCDNLVERTHIVTLEEIATLLESLFTSDTPLTNTFLEKNNSYGMIHRTLCPALHEDRIESKADEMIMLIVYVNKKEGNILNVECGEDFVDLLFTFLAIPLESLWETLGKRIRFGCIGNLCRDFKDLNVHYRREAKCVLPYYYKCQKQLLDVVTFHMPPTYYRYLRSPWHGNYSFSNDRKRLGYDENKLVPVIWIDPKSEGKSNTIYESTTPSGGFVKKGMKFMITDDLIITPSKSTSTIGLLKEKQIRLTDVEVQVIIIGKEEALRLLEASLVTSSALSTVLLAKESASTSEGQNRVYKQPKIET